MKLQLKCSCQTPILNNLFLKHIDSKTSKNHVLISTVINIVVQIKIKTEPLSKINFD